MMKAPIKTLRWEENSLYIIDQSELPLKEKVIRLRTIKEVWKAIRELKVRGAPAIGVAAGYGIALSVLKSKAKDFPSFYRELKSHITYLKTCRPTAYNLFFVLERIESVVEENSGLSIEKLKKRIVEEANKIFEEDLICGYKIGQFGSKLIKNGMNILTHCNAGGLATAGFGTALSVFFAAKKTGKKFHVFVDETRPVLQGARLTTWELEKMKIPYTLICDNTAGYLMSQEKIDTIIVGADRIALNGDTANKIGTYSLAVLSIYHKVKFYIAAPLSTFDPNIKTGKQILIEERNSDEIKRIKKIQIAPVNASVYNPAFDVTPSGLISGFITEKGIIQVPYGKNIPEFLFV